MSAHTMTAKNRSALRAVILLLLLAGLVIIGAYADLPGRLRIALDWIDSLGIVGPLLYVLLYIVITVLLLPGSILTMGAGAVFGVAQGTLLTSIGSTLGATAAFLVGRFFLRDWVAAKAAANPRFQAVDEAIGREGGKIIFLLRMSPLMPYNLSNYLYSLSKVSVRAYILASWLGMLPGTLLYVYIGSLLESLSMLAAEGRARTPAEWALYAAGLAATIVVTIYVTRLARRAIQQSVPVEEEAENAE